MMDEDYLSGDELAIKVRKPYTITKKRERWTQEEHQKFLEGLKLHGRAWRCIEDHIATKSAVQIRSHAQKFFSKVGRQQTGGSVASVTAEEIDIPPPRPKRKPIHPYPRKAVRPFDISTRLHTNGSSLETKSMHVKRFIAAPMVSTDGGGFTNEQLASKGQQFSSFATTLKLFGQTVVVSTADKSLTSASTTKAKKTRRTFSGTVLTQGSGKPERTLHSIMYNTANDTESNRDNRKFVLPRSGSGNVLNCAKPSSRSASKVSSESSLVDSGISNLNFEHGPYQTCQKQSYDFYPKEQRKTVLNHEDPFKGSSSQNAAGQYPLPAVVHQQQAYRLPLVPDLNYDQCQGELQPAHCSLGELADMTSIVPPCGSSNPHVPLQLFKEETCTSVVAAVAATAFWPGILPQTAPAGVISPLFARVSLGGPSEEAELLQHAHAKDNTKVQTCNGVNPEQNLESANEANSLTFMEIYGRRFPKEHSKDQFHHSHSHHTVLSLATTGLEEPGAILPTFAEGSNLSFTPENTIPLSKASRHDHKKKETKSTRESSFSGSNFFLSEDTGSDVHKKQNAIAFVADSDAPATAQACCEVMPGASGGPSSNSSNCEDSQDAAAQIDMQRSGNEEHSSYVGGMDRNQANNIKYACYKQKAKSNKSSSSGSVMHQSCKRKVKQ